MPHSRPMPVVGQRCHELRVNDKSKTWRLIYRIDMDAILVIEVFEKKSRETPQTVIEACQRRLKLYEGVRP
jgi:phage-related protein